MWNNWLHGHFGDGNYKNLPYKFIRFKGNITSISDIKKWLDENNFHYYSPQLYSAS